MAKNRKAAEAFILEYIEKLLPGSPNKAQYEAFFKSMSDIDFEQYMKDLDTGVKFLTIKAPNYIQPALSVRRNLDIGKELGHRFFQRLWIGPKGDMPAYLTPIEYLVMDLPLKRMSQTLKKKISIPDSNKVIDATSGQPTGDSGRARVSYPEMQILTAMGMDQSVTELIKYRGGDLKGFNAMNAMIARMGSANQATLSHFSSGVESTRTLKTFLTAAHLKNTL